MLNIKITNKRFNCDLTLQYKVTIITGDSGKGKTVMVKALLDESGAYKLTMNEKIKIVELTNKTWETILSSDITEKTLFVVDDSDFVCLKEFGELFNKCTNCYLLIISRIINTKLKNQNGIPVSSDSVYKLCADGVEHTIVPVFDM